VRGKRPVAWLGLALGAAALVLQFGLTWTTRLAAGDSIAGMLWFFFTFFTILTNGMLVLIYLSVLFRPAWLGWWRDPVTRGMIAGTMLVVTGFYHVMLANLWAPEGAQYIADVSLHYVAPLLYVLWWLLFQPHGGLRFSHLPVMAIFPLAYLVWAMFRGAIVGEYPYPILNASELGYATVAVNCLVMVALFLAVFAVTVGVDRALGTKRQPV